MIDLEKLELFTGQFYPVIPNKGHKSRKSWSKRFEFSTLGATKVGFGKKLKGLGSFGMVKVNKTHSYADVEDNGVEPLPDGVTLAGMTFPTAVGTL